MHNILQQIKLLCIGHHRLIEIRQGEKITYMVQQRTFGFWINRYSQPLEDYDAAKKGYESCKAEYPLQPKVKKVLLEETPERLSWDTPSRPITPTPAEDK